MVLHRPAKADPSGYPGSIPGVGVLEAGYPGRTSLLEFFLKIYLKNFRVKCEQNIFARIFPKDIFEKF